MKKKTILIAGSIIALAAIVIVVVIFTRAKPAAFEVSNLIVEPAQAQPGQAIMIVATVTNTGESTGSYTAELKLDNNVIQSQSVSLVPEKSHMVSFTITKETVGTYTINLGGLAGQFTILQPAAFQLTDFLILPTEATQGEPVSIVARVTNNGGSAGEYTAELKINDTVIDTQTVSLDAAAYKVVTFTATTAEKNTGTYAVELGGMTGEFTVLPPSTAGLPIKITLEPGQRLWVITDADVSRLFAQISDVTLTAHFVPGNKAQFTMAGFPGVIDIGVIDGKLCEYPVDAIIYDMLPETHEWTFQVGETVYLGYTWFDPSAEIAPDVTAIPVMVSVTTENGQANVIYEWPPK